MTQRRSARRFGAVAVAAAMACLAPAALADPIPEGTDSDSAPAFIGHPAAQNPVAAPVPPAHPFMAPNERSNLHVDGFQTDTNSTPGPLGRQMQRTSTFQQADCASVTFDSRGRIVTICVGLLGPALGGAGLYMFDPHTLATLTKMDLPPKQPSLGGNPFQDFSSGGYFYLDNQDRAVIPTTTRHVFVVGETGAQPGFALLHDYDLSGVVPSGDKLFATMPDWSGRIWWVSGKGLVGTIDPASGSVKTFDTHEAIGNSFAVDETGGVYIVTDGAMYRFAAGPDGTPTVSWRSTYPNDGTAKPGQTEIGSGTTPTVTASSGLVAITDNADPIDVVVYRRDTGAQVCSAPLFTKGASDTDQSLVAVGDSFIAENNYGYSGPAAVEQGRTTKPGLERVDVVNGQCRKVWHSDEIAPTVVPKGNLANGLVYTYTHPASDQSDPWYFTALDFRTGRTVYKFRAGSGLGFNNNYAPVTIGPDGTAYIGTLGGLALVRDATPPPGAAAPQASSSPTRATRPAVRLRARRSCRRGTVRLRLTGAAKSVVFRIGNRRKADRRAPFAGTIRIHGRRARRAVARVTFPDGSRAGARTKVPRCR